MLSSLSQFNQHIYVFQADTAEKNVNLQIHTYCYKTIESNKKRWSTLYGRAKCKASTEIERKNEELSTEDIEKQLVIAAGYKTKGGHYAPCEDENLIHEKLNATLPRLASFADLTLTTAIIRKSMVSFMCANNINAFRNKGGDDLVRKETIDGYIRSMQAGRHWTYSTDNHKAIFKWIEYADSIKSQQQALQFLIPSAKK